MIISCKSGYLIQISILCWHLNCVFYCAKDSCAGHTVQHKSTRSILILFPFVFFYLDSKICACGTLEHAGGMIKLKKRNKILKNMEVGTLEHVSGIYLIAS